MKKLAVDVMGGDFGIKVTLPACLRFLKKYSDINLVVFGDEEQILNFLKNKASFKAFDNRIEIIHASEVIDMDEAVANALRNKKQSSMRLAINALKRDEVDAVVSAGNTGALMALAKIILKTVLGIERPAICTTMPTILDQPVYMLDLGANVGSSAEHLFQFAFMANLMLQSRGIENPRIGLLNIGEEESKGHEEIREAVEYIKEANMNYQGYVEGNNILSGRFDIVVSDGFDGNIALKTMEGTANFVVQSLKKAFKDNWYNRLIYVISLPVLSKFKKFVDPRNYNGASLLGLSKIVIKSHGSADTLSFLHALEEARIQIAIDTPNTISKEIARIENMKLGA